MLESNFISCTVNFLFKIIIIIWSLYILFKYINLLPDFFNYVSNLLTYFSKFLILIISGSLSIGFLLKPIIVNNNLIKIFNQVDSNIFKFSSGCFIAICFFPDIKSLINNKIPEFLKDHTGDNLDGYVSLKIKELIKQNPNWFAGVMNDASKKVEANTKNPIDKINS